MLFIRSNPQFIRYLGVACAILATGPVQAEIYKHIDSQGRVTYSNVPMKGAVKLNLDPLTTVPGSRPRASAPSPANFPKVDSDTQKKRDDTRRKILEEELEAEEKLLAEASGKKDAAAVELHAGNVAALKKELANIK